MLDSMRNEPKRIINIYRSFNPQDGSTPKSNFISQLLLIKEAYQKNSIVLGDFNLNLLMRDNHNYDGYDMFAVFEEIKYNMHKLVGKKNL